MPVPKKRRSKMHSRRQFATWKITPPELTGCPQCSSVIKPYTICPVCGYYKGREVIKIKVKTKKKEK